MSAKEAMRKKEALEASKDCLRKERIMGFFRDLLRKANGQTNDAEMQRILEKLRIQIEMLQSFALAMDAENDSDDDISLFVCLQLDLLSFALHIASSDNVLEQSEVNAINAFLGSDFSYSECKSLIEEGGLGSAVFNSTIPTSFKLLTEFAKYADGDAKGFAASLIYTYKVLGTAIAAVDGDFDAREKQNLDSYISRLEQYAERI